MKTLIAMAMLVATMSVQAETFNVGNGDIVTCKTYEGIKQYLNTFSYNKAVCVKGAPSRQFTVVKDDDFIAQVKFQDPSGKLDQVPPLFIASPWIKE